MRYGDVDNVSVFLLLLILRERGRAAEAGPLLHRLAALDRSGAARWPVLLGALAAETGRLEEARRHLAPLVDAAFASLDDQSRTGLVALLADALVTCGAARGADRLAPLLAPWAGQAIVVGAGAGCLGAADHYLGLLTGSRELLLRGRDLHVALQAPLLVAPSDRALDAHLSTPAGRSAGR